MKRTKIIVIALSCIFFFIPPSFAQDRQLNTVYIKAPVSIGNIGIQNLVVGISYDTVAKDEEFLQSPEFRNFMNGLRVELQSIAMQEILAHPYLTLDTIADLAGSIQAKTGTMVEDRLQAHFPDKQITIPVAISRVEFYNTDRATLYIDRNDL